MSEQEQGSFLDYNLDSVPDLSTVPADQEYELRCTAAEVKVSKGAKTAGQQLILAYFSIEGEPDTKPVSYPVMLPDASLDEEANNQRKRQLKELVLALGLDPSSGFNVDELVGESGYAILGVQDSAEYGEQNTIKRFVSAG